MDYPIPNLTENSQRVLTGIADMQTSMPTTQRSFAQIQAFSGLSEEVVSKSLEALSAEGLISMSGDRGVLVYSATFDDHPNSQVMLRAVASWTFDVLTDSQAARHYDFKDGHIYAICAEYGSLAEAYENDAETWQLTVHTLSGILSTITNIVTAAEQTATAVGRPNALNYYYICRSNGPEKIDIG